MRPQQIYIGIGVGALSIALWGTVPARAEAPAKPEEGPRAQANPAAPAKRAAKPAAKPKPTPSKAECEKVAQSCSRDIMERRLSCDRFKSYGDNQLPMCALKCMELRQPGCG